MFVDQPSFTIEAWVKLTSRVASYSGVDPPPASYTGVEKNPGIISIGNTYLNIGFDGGYFYAYWKDTDARVVRAVGQTPLNEWHHFAAIFDGDTDTVTLYDDGKQVAQSGTIWKGLDDSISGSNTEIKLGTGYDGTDVDADRDARSQEYNDL